MKCAACGHAMEAGRGRCPACGFPVIYMAGSGDGKKALEAMAKDYRKRNAQNGVIGIKAYRYRKDAARRELSALELKEEIRLFRTEDVCEDRILWSKRSFENAVAKADMPEGHLWMFLEDGNGRRDFRVKMTNPDIRGRYYVGIQGAGAGRAVIVFGDKERYTRSEPVSLTGEEGDA